MYSTIKIQIQGLNSASDADRAYVRDRFGCCTDVEVGDAIDDGGGKVLVAGRGEQLLCPSCNHAVGERIGEAFSVSGGMAAGGVLLQVMLLL